jgi:hypothetical protein
MNKKANKRTSGLTQTELLILITMSGILLCATVLFGGYIIYALNRPIPVAIPPTSMPTLVTQPSIQPTDTSTLVPKATARPTFTAIPTATIFVIPTITAIPTATIFVTPTKSIPTEAITATTTVTPVPIETIIANLSQCEKTISEKYRVILKYPANWGCNITDDNALGFSRPEGFIEISLRQVLKTAKQFCEIQIQDSHGLNRFGKNPIMKILQIDNRSACLVYPSSDQSPKYQKASLLVVEYPQSVLKDTLLLLSADKSHIHGFISTLRFVR